MFGLKVALIEQGAMGGECLNTGCVPSKALIAAAARAQAGRDGARLGVTLSGIDVDLARGARAMSMRRSRRSRRTIRRSASRRWASR